MVKIYFKILLIVLLTGLSLSMSEAAVSISSTSVLNDSQLEIMVNNQKVSYLAVPYNNVLYVDRNLFSSGSMNGETIFTISGQNYTCVPLFSTLNSYGVLYDYRQVYDKAMVVIVTDPALAQQYTSSAQYTQPSNVNINIEEDNDVDYPWGLGLAVANTIHYFSDDDWNYIYRHNYVPDRFVWIGQNGSLVKGDDRFILNTDNRFFVKGDDGYINVKKDNVYYRNNGDNFGVFNNNVNNVNLDRNINNVNLDRNINNVNVDRNVIHGGGRIRRF